MEEVSSRETSNSNGFRGSFRKKVVPDIAFNLLPDDDDDGDDNDSNWKNRPSPLVRTGSKIKTKIVAEDFANIDSDEEDDSEKKQAKIPSQPQVESNFTRQASFRTSTAPPPAAPRSNHTSIVSHPVSNSPVRPVFKFSPFSWFDNLSVDDFLHHILKHSVSVLTLSLSELMHIRHVQARAEVERLVSNVRLYEDVKGRKLCFVCRKAKLNPSISSSLTCSLCQQQICRKCALKVILPSEAFDHSLAIGPVNEQRENPLTVVASVCRDCKMMFQTTVRFHFEMSPDADVLDEHAQLFLKKKRYSALLTAMTYANMELWPLELVVSSKDSLLLFSAGART